MTRDRQAQLAYSELMAAMLDEESRRRKAAKIVAVLRHFVGGDLAGRTVVDVGCSAGFIADELAAAGAGRTLGVDIDTSGLAKAQDRFGARVTFLCGDGERLPLGDGSVDVAVFNHIYEHVVDPDRVVRELHRVLAPDGVLYLGLANRLGVVEPHYRLPFLSWLPPAAADRYVRASGRADHYHERLRTRLGLRRMLRGFHVWDYTLPILLDPGGFAAQDIVPARLAARLSAVPRPVLRALLPAVPTYVWVATKSARRPAGAGPVGHWYDAVSAPASPRDAVPEAPRRARG